MTRDEYSGAFADTMTRSIACAAGNRWDETFGLEEDKFGCRLLWQGHIEGVITTLRVLAQLNGWNVKWEVLEDLLRNEMVYDGKKSVPVPRDEYVESVRSLGWELIQRGVVGGGY